MLENSDLEEEVTPKVNDDDFVTEEKDTKSFLEIVETLKS